MAANFERTSEKFYEDAYNKFNYKLRTLLGESVDLQMKMEGLKDTDEIYQKLKSKLEVVKIKIEVIREARETLDETYDEHYPERCDDEDDENEEDEEDDE